MNSVRPMWVPHKFEANSCLAKIQKIFWNHGDRSQKLVIDHVVICHDHGA